MKFGSLLGLGTLGLALIGIPLAAQAMTTTYGGQVTLSLPAGPLSSTDWLDGKVGGGVGLHALIGFEGGHAIVPRLDYTYFKKSEDGVDRKVQMYQLGADYNYFLSKQVNSGPYVGGGLGVATTKFELTGFGESKSDTPTTVYGAASAGWMFTPHLGAELRYTWSRYKPDVTDFSPRGYTGKPTVDAPTLNASLIVRL
jgi:hypothetical protein